MVKNGNMNYHTHYDKNINQFKTQGPDHTQQKCTFATQSVSSIHWYKACYGVKRQTEIWLWQFQVPNMKWLMNLGMVRTKYSTYIKSYLD